MTHTSSHPAVFAGLLGSAAWSVPKIVLASPLEDAEQALSNSLLLQFVAGCAVGIIAAGAISVVLDRVVDRFEEADDAPEEIREGSSDGWEASSLNLALAQDEVGEDDPTGDLGRFRTGQITIDLPIVNDETAVSVPREQRSARHFAAADASSRTSTRRRGRHFADVHQAALAEGLREAVEVKTPRRTANGKHFAGSPATRSAAPTARMASHDGAATHYGMPAVDERISSELDDTAGLGHVRKTLEKRAQAAADKNARRMRLAQLPQVYKQQSKAANTRVPSNTPAHKPAAPYNAPAFPVPTEPSNAYAAQNLGIASSQPLPVTSSSRAMGYGGMRTAYAPVPKPGYTQPHHGIRSILEKTRQVRADLTDRITTTALNGVPVIERGNSRTAPMYPAWPDQAASYAQPTVAAAYPQADPYNPAYGMDEPANPVTKVSRPSRAAYISSHIAEVDLGMFPERRTGDDLDHENLWQEAIAAMDDKIADSATITPYVTDFYDVVGGPSTIDDPEGLEDPTNVLPFRVARSGAVDYETYVEHLLHDEITNGGPKGLRRTSHSYLRVIEGGTNNMPVQRSVSDSGSVSTGRHFAAKSYAREA